MSQLICRDGLPAHLRRLLRTPSAELRTRDSELELSNSVGLDVPSLIGAAIIMRKSIIGDLGGFDERFFFFLEETDLCVRARERGTRVVFFAAAKVIHLQGRTVRKDWVRGRLQYNISLYKFIRKHHGALYYRLFQGTRFIKCCVLLVALSVIPLSLLSARTRRERTATILLCFYGTSGDAGMMPDYSLALKNKDDLKGDPELNNFSLFNPAPRILDL